MTSHDSNILSDLHVSLKQVAKSPLAVTITVTNNSPRSVTILTWDSPLDGLALHLGLLTLTPAGKSAPLGIPTINVSRQLPPTDASLVGLAPGESRENDVVFPELLVPLQKIKGQRIGVKLKGRWTRVWKRARAELTQEMIEDFGADGNAVSGEFETDSIEIEVE